jgi:hypothetical protein
MSTNEPTIYKYLGTKVTVYSNRMEVQLPGGFFGKKEMIPFRNITSIEKPPLLACIDITTSDGKKHRITLSPSDNKKIKEQIESLL